MSLMIAAILWILFGILVAVDIMILTAEDRDGWPEWIVMVMLCIILGPVLALRKWAYRVQRRAARGGK